MISKKFNKINIICINLILCNYTQKFWKFKYLKSTLKRKKVSQEERSYDLFNWIHKFILRANGIDMLTN